MKPLLVPTDFSASAINAAKYAGDMAVAINADLYLLHVLQLPVSTTEVPLTDELFEDMQDAAKSDMSNLKAELDKHTGGKVNIFTLIETGSIEHEIEEFCVRRNPFAVIMGSKKNGAERFMFGSNALYAIKHLHHPLMIIPNDVSFHNMRKIVLACDLSDVNKSIPIDTLKEIQQAFHSTFDVLNVNKKNISDLKSNLEFILLKDLLKDLYPTYHFNIANTVEEGISHFLENHDIDLLVLIPKRHNVFEFHQSHTKKMVLKGAVPILAIHG
ncbi:MAG: universal stress protein [Bacteroidetes bacterium]|nr:universal stress protein [Bacteroidota bacterium]